MDAEHPVIATHRFQTEGLAADDQFPAWAAFTTNSRVTRAGEGPFFADAAFWRLEGMIVSRQTVDPFTMDRDAHYLRTTPAGHLLIVLPYDGESRFVAPGIDAICGAGDIIVANLGRLGRCENLTRQSTIAVSLSRAFLEEATGPADAHGRLEPTPETRLFVAFMRSLVEQLPSLSEASVGPLSRIVRDLFGNIVVGLPREASARDITGLPARARAYILQQPAGRLDVAAMTQALATTRSTLFRAFKAEGGVLAFDRRRRLRLVHRALADPLDHRPIAEIGFEHGFTDPAHLARQFRQTFGYSMSVLRSQLDLKAAAPTPLGRSAAEHYRDMVSALV